MQQIKTLEAEIEELKRQLSQKKSKTSEYTYAAPSDYEAQTVTADNFTLQDLVKIHDDQFAQIWHYQLL